MDLLKPHDALFRFAFDDDREAAILLRAMLRRSPAGRAVADQIDWSGLRRLQDGFRDAADRPHATDFWFAAPLCDEVVLLHVILEHKSRPDALTAWQVTRYTVRTIDSVHLKSGQPPRLPLVVPMVVYHGDEPWRVARDVRDLFALPEALSADARQALREMLPSCTYQIHDLAEVADSLGEGSRLGLVAGLAVHFLCHMRNLTSDELVVALAQVRDLLVAVQEVPRGRLLLGMLFCYLRATAKADAAEIHDAVRQTLPPKVGDEMLNPLERAFEEATNRGFAEGSAKGMQHGMQQGMQHGIQQGMQQGMHLGQRAMLRSLLQSRFGPLSEAVLIRLDAASLTQLEAWAVRLFEAATVDEVIGS